MIWCSSLLTVLVCHLQGGLPANSSTRQFAQELMDRLPGKSGSNGRAPAAAPTQRAQDAAAHALLRQSAQYSLLIDDDEEDGAAPELPAPTTAPLPKKREKKLRKDKAGVSCKLDKFPVQTAGSNHHVLGKHCNSPLCSDHSGKCHMLHLLRLLCSSRLERQCSNRQCFRHCKGAALHSSVYVQCSC